MLKLTFFLSDLPASRPDTDIKHPENPAEFHKMLLSRPLHLTLPDTSAKIWTTILLPYLKAE